jgi:hypothetical protein
VTIATSQIVLVVGNDKNAGLDGQMSPVNGLEKIIN